MEVKEEIPYLNERKEMKYSFQGGCKKQQECCFFLDEGKRGAERMCLLLGMKNTFFLECFHP